MKKLIFATVLGAVAVGAIRRYGPVLKTAMARCHEMMSAATRGDARPQPVCACERPAAPEHAA